MRKKLYLVVPCYNEEEVLRDTSKKLKMVLMELIGSNKISKKSKILFVNDGSTDNTWNVIKKLNQEDNIFLGIKLSRNYGQQKALFAGLMYTKDIADITISIDADLQDDINVIKTMVDKYDEGFEIVYGVRKSRQNDSWFKRTTAQVFYKLMQLMGANIIYNHADYRLMSQKAINALSEFREVNLFLRGLVPLLGYQSTTVYYERKKRLAGETKYSLKKMISFAFDGITSFSIKPLRLILNLGVIILIISIIIMIYSLIQKILGHTVAGWAFIVISIWFIGGLQMISIGIIGEYIAKIYSEAKQRPRYLIEEVIDN